MGCDPDPGGDDTGASAGETGGGDSTGSDPTTTGAESDPTASGDDESTGDGPQGSTGDGPQGSTGEEPESSTGEDPPPSGLDCEGRDDLILCDDFEGGSIDEDRWEIIETNGVVMSVDESFAYHGGGALRVSLPSADAARGGLVHSDSFPVAGNHFFGRAWFYVGPTVPQTHCSAFGASGPLDGAGARYRLDSNGGEFNSRYTHNPTVEQHGGLKKFGYDVPVEQWLCVEWEYDGPNSTMRYWMGGEEVEEMTVTQDSEPQQWVAPIFQDFEIGWRTYQADDPTDVYWDAVALATFRIGCE